LKFALSAIRGETVNRQDAKNVGDRMTRHPIPPDPQTFLAPWHLGGSFGRENADLPRIGQHVVGADSVSLSSKFQMRFPCALTAAG
jgi:hypothetical protein